MIWTIALVQTVGPVVAEGVTSVEEYVAFAAARSLVTSVALRGPAWSTTGVPQIFTTVGLEYHWGDFSDGVPPSVGHEFPLSVVPFAPRTGK